MNTNKYKPNLFSSELLEIALTIINKSSDKIHKKISGYIKIAEAYNQFEQDNDAELVIQETLNLVHQNKNDAYLYYALEDIAEYYTKHNNKQKAIDLLEWAFTIIEKIFDYEERDNMLVRIGGKFCVVGEYEKAFNCAELIEDDFDKAELYKYLIWEYTDTKQYEQVNVVICKAKETGWEDLLLEEAVECYLEHKEFERASESIEMMTQEQSKVSALLGIAQKYQELNNKSKAIVNLNRAKAIADRIQDSSSKSWSLQAIFRVAKQIDTSQSSETLLSASVESAKQIDEPFLQGFAFNNLAFQLASAGRYDEAIEIIESSNPFVPTFQKIRLLIQIADRYLKSSQLAQADQMINMAMKTVAEITGNELAIPKEDAQSFAWNDLAEYALRHQQYELALTVLEQIETIDGKIHLLVSISNTYIENGKEKEARKTLQQAVEILLRVKDRKKTHMATEIANLYARIKDYSSAIQTVKLIPTDVSQAQTLVAIALKYAELPEAVERETIELLETLI